METDRMANASQRASSRRRRPKSLAWKEVFLVGSEWDSYDAAFDIDWDFSHFEESLIAGAIAKYAEEHPVYIFGSTEPQWVHVDPSDPDSATVVPIPVLFAIHCEVPPPSMLGVTSVQREEEIIPMSSLKMGWAPYMSPSEFGRVNPMRFKPSIYMLKCSQRREGLHQLTEDQMNTFPYALPYVLLPNQAKKITYPTAVKVMVELDGKAFHPFDYDWVDYPVRDKEALGEFVADLIEDYALDSKHEDYLKKAILDTVKRKKMEIAQEKADLKSQLESMSAKQRTALDNMKVYKYYPKNSIPDILALQSPKVNRYYGEAHHVYGREMTSEEKKAKENNTPAFVFKKVCD